MTRPRRLRSAGEVAGTRSVHGEMAGRFTTAQSNVSACSVRSVSRSKVSENLPEFLSWVTVARTAAVERIQASAGIRRRVGVDVVG